MLSKSDQLKKSEPLRPKPYKDKNYLAWLHNQGFGCLVCNSLSIELHHVKEHSTDQRDDRYVICLCPEHHRGNILSPHGTPKKWKEEYPMEFQYVIANKLFNLYKGEQNDNF